MDGVLQEGHAEKVPDNELQRDYGRLWYMPHHGVYHPQKKTICVVFNCAATYREASSNKGPDLTNMLGVLPRFRQEPIAMMANIVLAFP